jgi:flap endonuclease-1
MTLNDLKSKSFAVDAFNVLHQFLALVRTRDGTPLMDKNGNITSHLVGLVFRATRLVSDYNIKLVFVFDGKPPPIKSREIEKRRNERKKAEKEYQEAVKKGDLETAYSKAVMTGRLTSQGVLDAKRLLNLLGIPWVQAPSEGEAQAAHMALCDDVWATNSRDYDSILFGSPRLVRYLTISGEEWLPSKRKARKLLPELIELTDFLEHIGLTRNQLIDLSILIGTDFNNGIKGIGPKTALKLMKKHSRLEELPAKIKEKLPEHYQTIRDIYLNPPITNDYSIKQGILDEDGLYSFLCDERAFSPNRVEIVINRMKKAHSQKTITDFFGRKS